MNNETGIIVDCPSCGAGCYIRHRPMVWISEYEPPVVIKGACIDCDATFLVTLKADVIVDDAREKLKHWESKVCASTRERKRAKDD